MKRIVAFLLCALMMLSLAACGKTSEPAAETPKNDTTAQTQTQDSGWKWTSPVEIMAPASAGGGLDTTLRALQPYLEKELGTSIVIDCRSGGSGVTGYTYSFNETPRDGFHYQFTAPTAIFSMAAGKFDIPVWDELVPVSGCVQAEGMIFCNPKCPFKTVQELIDYAKANPKKVSIAIDAPTGNSGVLCTQFEQGAGVEFNWVVGGADESLISTIAGETDLLLATWADSAAYVGSGDIVALCVLGTERNEVIGDVPSSAEVGVPIELGYSRMFTCLKGTPQEAADAFEAALHRACKQAGWEQWLAENGFSNNYLWDHTETGEALKAFYTLGQELLNK